MEKEKSSKPIKVIKAPVSREKQLERHITNNKMFAVMRVSHNNRRMLFTRWHPLLSEANTEAERLANENKESLFIVVQRVGYACRDKDKTVG